MSSPTLRSKILKVIKNYKIHGCRYLDIGCSDDTLTTTIAKTIRATEVCGVDIDNTLLQKLPPSVKGYKFDLEMLESANLPFEDNYFDFVTAVEVIEHLSHGDHLTVEVFRVLKRGDCFLLTTPNLASWINRLLLVFGQQPIFTEPSKYYWVGLPKGIRKKEASAYGHKNLYTLKAIISLLKVYGFVLCYVNGCKTYNRRLLGVIDEFLHKFSSLAPILIVLAKKLNNVPTNRGKGRLKL